MSKKTLFIDFDGTICFDYFWRSADENKKESIRTRLFGEDASLVQEWMIGLKRSEDVNEILASHLSEDYEALWTIFVEDCKTMNVRELTFEKLLQAKQFFETVLITDNMDSFDRFTVPALELEKYFHYIANSYNYKTTKDREDGLFFQMVSQKYNIDITNSILIDNSVDNCNNFERLGGKSILVKVPEDIELALDKLISENQSLDVKVA